MLLVMIPVPVSLSVCLSVYTKPYVCSRAMAKPCSFVGYGHGPSFSEDAGTLYFSSPSLLLSYLL